MVPASILQFAKTESSSAQEVESPLLRAFADRILAHAQNEGDTLTAIPGFRIFRRTELTSCTSAAYEPSLILYAQGQKTVQVGDSSYICDAAPAS